MRAYRVVIVLVAAVTIFAVPVSAQTYFQAVINSGQEVPPNPGTATGLGCFVLNANNTLDYLISYVGLIGVEISSHIHGPAPVGINAGVQFPLPLGTPKIGTVGPLTALQVADLSDGLYYVNIHSTLYPGGEIRGQILTAGTPCTVATEQSTWGTIKALYR